MAPARRLSRVRGGIDGERVQAKAALLGGVVGERVRVMGSTLRQRR